MQGEPPTTASTPTGAVFLSYASQDAEAARRICEALRAAGVEVWFDQSELRGGDVWDRRIREQIHECRLFVPLVSANTEARVEGYFRREWRLAVDRTHDLSERVAFVVPVVIDSTSEPKADVPDAFRQVQWIRLPDGETSPAFVDRVRRLIAPAPAPGAVTRVPPSSSEQRSTTSIAALRRDKPALSAICVMAALVIAYFVADRFWLSKHPTSSTASTSVAGGPVSPYVPEKSIAVLPFVDLSEGRDQEYLADGMAEEILDLLARIPQLSVIGRTSSFQFKGRNEDLRSVGAKLAAVYIVEGSVRKSGTRIRVTTQLIDAHTGAHLWSETSDREFDDVLDLQDHMASGIARQLQLVVDTTELAAGRAARNMDAYTLYLRGRVAFDRGDSSALREAQGYFEQALAIDPTLSRASEGLLLTDLNLVYVGVVPPMTGWPRVRKLAEDTLRLDPRSVFAHSALAWVYAYYDYDRAGCNREIDAALATPTRDPVALMYTAWIAAVVRRMDDAERLIRQSLVIDPLSPDAYQGLGAILRDSGDLAGAESAFRQSLVISPTFAGTHVYLAEVLFFGNRFADALTEANAEAPGAARHAVLAGIHSALGHRRESDALLADLIRSSDDTYWIAVAYTMRGEKDQAFANLDRAYARRDLSLHMSGDLMFTSLRTDPRWAALMGRMNTRE